MPILTGNCCKSTWVDTLVKLKQAPTDLLQAIPKNDRKRSKQMSSKEAGAGSNPQPTQKTLLDLHMAMKMYGLTGSELFCELKLDTRCLMGWNNNTIVLAFRGTASMTNALSDLQVVYLSWRAASSSNPI